MKSMLRLMLCLLTCMLLAMPALADMEGDYTYYIDEMIGGAVLTGYSGSETDVAVPDTLGGYPVLRLSFGAFHDSTAIESVILPDSLQYMDGSAFNSNTNLKSVYLPENLIEFTNCGDTGVRYYVDMHSATAQLMSNPEGGFPSNRFFDPDYPDLKLYYTTDASTGTHVLGLYAYYGSGDTLVVPDFIQSIYGAYLIDNTSVKSIYLPENLIEFQYPSHVQADLYADMYSNAAKQLLNAAGAYPGYRFFDPKYPSMKLFYTANAATGAAELGLYKYIAKDEKTVTIPDGIMHIYDQAFVPEDYSQNTVLEEIRLPDSVVSIGSAVFSIYNLPSLESIYLSENISSWGDYPFNGQFYLRLYCPLDSTTIRTMTQDVTSLSIVDPADPDFAWLNDGSGWRVLSGYYGSEPHVTIPDGTTAIGKNAFSGNTTLTSVTFPSSLESIGDYAFYGNTALTSVTFPSSLESIGDYAFADNVNLTAAILPDGLTHIGMYAFYGNTALTSVTFPSSLESIGDYAFAENVNLTAAVLPDGLSQIGMYAFYNAKKLSKIVVPDNVHIDTWAFNYDYWADPENYVERTIHLPDNLTFGDYPFCNYATTLILNQNSNTANELARLNDERGGGALYSFIDPRYPDYLIGQYGGETYMIGYLGSDSVMNIPPIFDVIERHINLRSPYSGITTHINVPEGVTRLAARSLWGWFGLQSLQLPSTLREIGEYAFSNTDLPVLIIPDGVTHLPAYMTDNSIIRYITIPASVTSIDDTAIITSGGGRTYKIYCNKGSYAEKWAKAHSVPIGYLENANYSFYVSEQFIGDVGETINWRDTVSVAPIEPDFPYTITAKSSDPSIVSVEGDMLSFNGVGKVSLTFSSAELDYSTTIKEVRSYEPVKSFSVPEYVFAKFRSSGTISVSDVVPAKNTNPVYRWYRPETLVLGDNTADVEAYKMYGVNAPGVFPFTVTAGSGVSRSFTFVHYESIDSAVFSPFDGYTASGMTVLPRITVTIDGIAYESIPATYTLTSSNNKVAKPTADGRLALLNPGTATITAKFLGGKTAKQTITVVGENIYTISAGVTAIEAEAFLACPVTIAVIPDGCVSIGARAFADCADMHRIEIPASVTSIAEDAFDGCSGTLVIAAPADSTAAEFAAAHGFALEAM